MLAVYYSDTKLERQSVLQNMGKPNLCIDIVFTGLLCIYYRYFIFMESFDITIYLLS